MDMIKELQINLSKYSVKGKATDPNNYLIQSRDSTISRDSDIISLDRESLEGHLSSRVTEEPTATQSQIRSQNSNLRSNQKKGKGMG